MAGSANSTGHATITETIQQSVAFPDDNGIINPANLVKNDIIFGSNTSQFILNNIFSAEYTLNFSTNIIPTRINNQTYDFFVIDCDYTMDSFVNIYNNSETISEYITGKNSTQSYSFYNKLIQSLNDELVSDGHKNVIITDLICFNETFFTIQKDVVTNCLEAQMFSMVNSIDAITISVTCICDFGILNLPTIRKKGLYAFTKSTYLPYNVNLNVVPSSSDTFKAGPIVTLARSVTSNAVSLMYYNQNTNNTASNAFTLNIFSLEILRKYLSSISVQDYNTICNNIFNASSASNFLSIANIIGNTVDFTPLQRYNIQIHGLDNTTFLSITVNTYNFKLSYNPSFYLSTNSSITQVISSITIGMFFCLYASSKSAIDICQKIDSSSITTNKSLYYTFYQDNLSCLYNQTNFMYYNLVTWKNIDIYNKLYYNIDVCFNNNTVPNGNNTSLITLLDYYQTQIAINQAGRNNAVQKLDAYIQYVSCSGHTIVNAITTINLIISEIQDFTTTLGDYLPNQFRQFGDNDFSVDPISNFVSGLTVSTRYVTGMLYNDITVTQDNFASIFTKINPTTSGTFPKIDDITDLTPNWQDLDLTIAGYNTSGVPPTYTITGYTSSTLLDYYSVLTQHYNMLDYYLKIMPAVINNSYNITCKYLKLYNDSFDLYTSNMATNISKNPALDPQTNTIAYPIVPANVDISDPSGKTLLRYNNTNGLLSFNISDNLGVFSLPNDGIYLNNSKGTYGNTNQTTCRIDNPTVVEYDIYQAIRNASSDKCAATLNDLTQW